MIVDDMPQASRARLVQIAEHALLIEAARLLTSGTDIIVVHDSDSVVRGVVTKTDVVKQMSLCQGASCLVPRASCLVPRASCLVPRASCLVPRASVPCPPS